MCEWKTQFDAIDRFFISRSKLFSGNSPDNNRHIENKTGLHWRMKLGLKLLTKLQQSQQYNLSNKCH